MLIKRLGGRVYTEAASALSTIGGADKIECIFEADDTLSVGNPVQLDTAGNTAGCLITPTIAAEDHMFVGVYEGKGGTGAATTTTGLSGNAAVDGDIVYVTTYGIATALVDGGSTAIAGGTILGASVTAGVFSVVSVALVAGSVSPHFALGVTTTTAKSTPCKIMVRAM